MGDVLGFRWAGQRLDGSAAGVVQAAAVALQDTPPGNAAVAAHVRASGISPGQVTDALIEHKDVLLVWSLRASPHLVPTSDLGVFTAGLRPTTEEGWLASLAGFGTVLGPTGLTATEAVEATVAALPEALNRRELTKRELGAALQPLMPESLRAWFDPQRFTEFTAMLTRAASLTGELCLTPRAGRREATFALTSHWLGRPLPTVDPAAARAELVRRYLRCYGPSTLADFAAWRGSAPAEAARAWNDAELVRVDHRWLHAADEDVFTAAAALPDQLTLLAAYDPWLALRDRSAILTDKAHQKQVWRSTGNPGVVLRAGRVAAIWRPAKKGKVLAITVTPFEALSHRDKAQIDGQAQALAPFRASTHATIVYD